MAKQLEGVSLPVKVFRWVQNTIFYQVLAVVSVYATWYGWVNYTFLWPWHIILATAGYVPLMAEAILLFAGDNVWSQDLDRKTKYWIHGVLLITSTVIIVVGNSIAFYYVKTIPHFSTAHGLTGFISMLLVLASFILGFAAANPQQFSHIARPVLFKFLHNILGIAGYVIGIVSLIYGYYTHWFVYYTSAETRIVASVATGFIAVWPLYAASRSCYEQFRNLIGR